MADIRSFFKKPRLSEPARPLRDPRSIVTWNANGLAPRIAHDLAALRAFVTERDPDVLLVQEARLRAHCDNPRAKADSTDARDRSRPDLAETRERDGALDRALRSAPLSEYSVHWSLANSRSAGTLSLVHRRVGEPEVLCAFDAARAALAAPPPPGGRGPGPRAPPPPAGARAAAAPALDVLHTYVPNNGWSPASRANRRRGTRTSACCRRVGGRGGGGGGGSPAARPLGSGDLNVAHTPDDSTDGPLPRRVRPRPTLARGLRVETPEADRGIPGFSDNERESFSALLARGGLVDAWRRLHPAERGAPPARGDAAFTWRGTLGVQQSVARYEGKAQRLDYHLVSEQLMPHVERCEILGHGAERTGFLGSDHCPVLLVLRDEAAATTTRDRRHDRGSRSRLLRWWELSPGEPLPTPA